MILTGRRVTGTPGRQDSNAYPSTESSSPSRSYIILFLATCGFAVVGLWRLLATRLVEPICKCGNKSLDYRHDNLTAFSSVAPFLPHVARQGIAVYTVFCGDGNNKANVVMAPVVAFPHYFVSDNEAAGQLAASRGWIFVRMFGNPDPDEIAANMKCKLPRTLPNLFGDLDLFKYLVYVDSKRANTLVDKDDAIRNEISKLDRVEAALVFNLHNFIKGDVWEEFEVATQHQARYRKHRADYLKYIQTRIHNSTLSGNKLLCGCFSIRDMDHPMTAVIGMNWYAEILKAGIEDQISLTFIYDRYKRFIVLTNETLGW